MEVAVQGNIDGAIQQLKKRIDRDGILRELRVRAYPQPGERRKAKASLAAKRRRQAEARRRIADSREHKGRPRFDDASRMQMGGGRVKTFEAEG